MPEHSLDELDRSRLPRHVAIIMDGNGRWARAEAIRDTVEAATEIGLEVLTLYAFSVENWKRPRFEVWTLMNLLKDYLRRESQRLVEDNIRLHFLGRWRELEPSVIAELESALDASRGCTGLTLNIALNYSGRCEIVDACRQIVADWAQGGAVEIDEQTVGRYLYTDRQPDPDLLIRTSGELRISNFLLWQIAYAEIWVADTLWPDFRRGHLWQAIRAYQAGERRFGAVDSATVDRVLAKQGL